MSLRREIAIAPRLRAPDPLAASVRITPRDPSKPPPASTGLGIKLGDLWRKQLEKKKEPKKP